MIPERVRRELRYIEMYTAKKMRNVRAGTYTSPLNGPGFDFASHRPYAPGDDVRRIDWNVTARVNTPYLKQTHAERELNVTMAVDLSRSMEFGSAGCSKKEAMTFVASSLVFSAAADQINTGVLAFTDRVLAYWPPRRTTARAWSILDELWSLAPPPARTAILPAVRHLLTRLKTSNLIFLVSDFMTEEDLFAGHDLRALAAKHDVIAVVVEDPAETVLPGGQGFLTVKDMESGAELSVGLGERARRLYSAGVERRRSDLIRSFYNVAMDHVFVRSDRPASEPLLELFANRKGR